MGGFFVAVVLLEMSDIDDQVTSGQITVVPFLTFLLSMKDNSPRLDRIKSLQWRQRPYSCV
jgi:hypothetical protein